MTITFSASGQLRPKLPTIKVDKILVHWTQWQVLELCKCETPVTWKEWLEDKNVPGERLPSELQCRRYALISRYPGAYKQADQKNFGKIKVSVSAFRPETSSTYCSPAPSLCLERRGFVYAVAGNQSLTTGASVKLFKSAAVCLVVVVICGCDQGQPDSFDATKKDAESGDAEAQFNLGLMYALGQGVPQDDAEAVKWYRLAADQGLAVAQYKLGAMYDTGEGVPQDYVEAVKWHRLAAGQGLADAQYNLGVSYRDGIGVPQDDAEAVQWTRLAADQGLAEAQYNLGVMYAYGEGVPQDYVEAVKWTRLAADQGLAEAQSNLGVAYLNGEGVPQDYVEAYVWFSVAAAGGHADAVKGRDLTASKLTPDQLSQGQKRATELLDKINSKQ